MIDEPWPCRQVKTRYSTLTVNESEVATNDQSISCLPICKKHKYTEYVAWVRITNQNLARHWACFALFRVFPFPPPPLIVFVLQTQNTVGFRHLVHKATQIKSRNGPAAKAPGIGHTKTCLDRVQLRAAQEAGLSGAVQM